MVILSFAMTTAALVNLEKTVTRRKWNDRYAEIFRRSVERNGGLAQAWDKSPRCGGKKVGEILVHSIVKEPTRLIPDSDWEAEGFGFMERSGLNLSKDLSCVEHWRQWRESEGEAYTVRFELVKVQEPIVVPWALVERVAVAHRRMIRDCERSLGVDLDAVGARDLRGSFETRRVNGDDHSWGIR